MTTRKLTLAFLAALLGITLVAVAPAAAGADTNTTVAAQNSAWNIDFGWTAATITLTPDEQRAIVDEAGKWIAAAIAAAACSGGSPVAAAMCGAGVGTVVTLLGYAVKKLGISDRCRMKITVGYELSVRKMWLSC